MAVIRILLPMENVLSAFDGTLMSHTSTLITLTGSNTSATLTGSAFVFDAANHLTSGVITGMSAKLHGSLAASIAGLYVDVTSIRTYYDIERRFFSGQDVFQGHNGSSDYFNGYAGNDTLFGLGGFDTLLGGDGNDKLFGGNDGDNLKGGAGNDTLVGGRGIDQLFGGAGADRFVFNGAVESNPVNGQRDVIYDFNHSEGDKINLSGIDANGSVAGNGVFHYIGSHDFTGARGEVRYINHALLGDLDGDKVADFGIRVVSSTFLSKGDLIL